VTIESPIEYASAPARLHPPAGSGRDTPSFDQALLDAMRENPDVLMVGEMREPATIRLTLNARRPATWCSRRSTPRRALKRCNGWSVLFAGDSSQRGRATGDCIVGVVRSG